MESAFVRYLRTRLFSQNKLVRKYRTSELSMKNSILVFGLLRYTIGLEKSRQFFIQSESKTKTNRDSLARVFFPRFASATYDYFEFWLVHCIVCILCDWLE